MKLIIYCLISIIVTAGAFGVAPDNSVAASLEHRAALNSAKQVRVSEGLPHQTWEPELLDKEQKRNGLIVIADYKFYSPATAAHNRADLAGVLSNPHSTKAYSGAKLCGGFHPDYCLSWESRGIVYHALICFGCSEVVFVRSKDSLHYDLSQPARDKLKELLEPYQSRRPKK